MTDKVLKILEYRAVLEKLAGITLSGPGKERIMSMLPSSDYGEVEQSLAQTDEAASLIAVKPGYPLCAFSDINAELMRLSSETPLNCGELLRVNGVLKAARRARAGVCGEFAPILTGMALELYYDDDIIKSIDGAVLSETEVADSASAALRSIRRRIVAEHEFIKEKLGSMIKNADTAKYLQDSIVTVRSGRYVVPVRTEHKGAVPGLVHDQSSTGQTLFIEPMAVVESNNRLKLLESEEKAEIERVLKSLSEMLYPHAQALKADLEILTRLDVVFAKASYARETKSVRPALNREGVTDLREGRHPLIDPAKVVSVSVKLGCGYNGLIITGPNTGGKTVTLKLVGLLQLMAQSGVFVPCAQGTRMTVFESVYADIGDEQSIEQSLSTFSSHMTNITAIIDRAGSRSLVLLDELGAGTDPAEGAALAAAILEELRDKGAFVVATTHYSEIKAFAMSQDYYENAGMEFDVNTLAPTYKLYLGVPGMSNAFLISERLGLSPSVIARARGHVSEERQRFEQVLGEAEKEKLKAEEKGRELEALTQRALERENEAEELLKLAKAEKDRYIAKARDEAERIVREAGVEAEEIIAELKKLKNQSPAEREITIAAQEARDAVKAARKKHERTKKPARAKNPASAQDILVGSEVYLVNPGVKATVISLPDSRGNLEVQAGVMKLKTSLSGVELIKKRKEYTERLSVSLSGAPAKLSVDVRGLSLEEAVMEVENYIDTCVLQGLHEVMIIHGRGTGVLMRGIRAHLKGMKQVKTFRAGMYGEGEMGVTVVTLK